MDGIWKLSNNNIQNNNVFPKKNQRIYLKKMENDSFVSQSTKTTEQKDLKELKRIFAAAKNSAAEAQKEADRAAETLLGIKESVAVTQNNCSKINFNSKEAEKIYEEAAALLEKNHQTSPFELNSIKKSKELINTINQSASESAITAEEILSYAEKLNAQTIESAQKAKDNADSIMKLKTIETAKEKLAKAKEDTQTAKTSSKELSVQKVPAANLSEKTTNNLNITNKELENICRAYIEIEKKLTEYDNGNNGESEFRVFGYDGAASDTSYQFAEDYRTKVFLNAGLADDQIQVKNIDVSVESQLSEKSKYVKLGQPVINKKNNQKMFICENLADMPDMNGVRGKTPLAGGKAQAIEWRLRKIKDNGIDTIIDLRAAGECSKPAKQAMEKQGFSYVNFPVEDSNWTLENLHQMTDLFKAINKGDFYIGCANGQSRTDLAVAINYVFNPKAINVPPLYYGTSTSSRVSIKSNINQIIELAKENPDVVKDWGWNDINEMIPVCKERLSNFKFN